MYGPAHKILALAAKAQRSLPNCNCSAQLQLRRLTRVLAACMHKERLRPKFIPLAQLYMAEKLFKGDFCLLLCAKISCPAVPIYLFQCWHYLSPLLDSSDGLLDVIAFLIE